MSLSKKHLKVKAIRECHRASAQSDSNYERDLYVHVVLEEQDDEPKPQPRAPGIAFPFFL